jgi:hypothetical protein
MLELLPFFISPLASANKWGGRCFQQKSTSVRLLSSIAAAGGIADVLFTIQADLRRSVAALHFERSFFAVLAPSESLSHITGLRWTWTRQFPDAVE